MHADGPAVSFDDPVDDSEAKAGSFSIFLRGEEWFKNVGERVVGDPDAVVFHGDLDRVGLFDVARFDPQESFIGHCLYRIDLDCKECLLDLLRGAEQGQRFSSVLLFEPDGVDL